MLFRSVVEEDSPSEPQAVEETVVPEETLEVTDSVVEEPAAPIPSVGEVSDPVIDEESSPDVDKTPEPVAEDRPLQDDPESVNDEAAPNDPDPSVEAPTVEESNEEVTDVLDNLVIGAAPTDEHVRKEEEISDVAADPYPDLDSAPTDEVRLQRIQLTEQELLEAERKKLEVERVKQLEIAEFIARKEAETAAKVEAEQRALELAEKELIPMDEAQADGAPVSPTGRVRAMKEVELEAKAQQQANVDCGCIIL